MTAGDFMRKILGFLVFSGFVAFAITPSFAADPPYGAFDGTYVGNIISGGPKCRNNKNVKIVVKDGAFVWTSINRTTATFRLNEKGAFAGAISSSTYSGAVDTLIFVINISTRGACMDTGELHRTPT